MMSKLGGLSRSFGLLQNPNQMEIRLQGMQQVEMMVFIAASICNQTNSWAEGRKTFRCGFLHGKMPGNSTACCGKEWQAGSRV
jgi:hypothetical protein